METPTQQNNIKEKALALAGDLEKFMGEGMASLSRQETHRLGSALQLILRVAGEPYRNLRPLYRERLKRGLDQ